MRLCVCDSRSFHYPPRNLNLLHFSLPDLKLPSRTLEALILKHSCLAFYIDLIAYR